MLARGLGAVASTVDEHSIWTPQRASGVTLQRMMAMWPQMAQTDVHRLYFSKIGAEIDPVLARFGVLPYFAGKEGAGFFTTTRASVLMKERFPLVRVRSSVPGSCHYMHCITIRQEPGGSTVYELSNGAPVARISVNGGWLYAMGMGSGPTSLQLFARVFDLLPSLKGPGSKRWNMVLLPSVSCSGTNAVEWLTRARYSDNLSLAGALQQFTLNIELPTGPDIVPAPSGGDGSHPAAFNGSTLLFMTDLQYRIKWLYHYSAADWEQFPM